MNDYIDKKYLTKLFAYLLLFVLACKVTNGMAFALLIPIVFSAVLMSRSVVVQYVILIATFSMCMGPFFIPRTIYLYASQKITLLAAGGLLALRVFGLRKSPVVMPFLSLTPYMVFIAIASQGGWAPAISNLKLILFCIVFLGMFGGAMQTIADHVSARKVRSMYLCLALFMIVGSILVYPLPGISIMGAAQVRLNPDVKSLYQGVTNHSQTLGVTSALLGVFVFSDWVFSIRKKSMLFLGLVVGALGLIWLSASRTALGAFLLGISFVALIALRGKFPGGRWRRKIVSSMVLIGIGGLFILLAVPSFREKCLNFVLKYKDSRDVAFSAENIMSTRQMKIDEALANWRSSPYVGNGFQVSEEMGDSRVSGIRDALTAPVEKSVWIYAVLEEGGIIGFILFVMFVLITLFALIRRKACICASVFATVIVSNLGEFTIFSMSGGGGVVWSLIFLASILDAKRIRGEAALLRRYQAIGGGYALR